MQIEKKIYKLPLFNIPFNEIKSLESFDKKYVCCSSISIRPFMNLAQYLVDVYNLYDDEITGFSSLKQENKLFGSVISEELTIRGKSKCIKIDTVNVEITKDELPDLKYSPDDIFSNEGKWFYTEKGHYQIFSGIRSVYENVKHLEGLEIYGDNILRLRTVIELLKINVDLGKTNMTIEEYLDVGFLVLKSDPSMSKIDDETIQDGVKNWMPTMLNMPLYSKIPLEIRGKKLISGEWK